MTKIKNTKKGMAKKTLSMSLVVAMLATSNVPVWAAEFSDGTDAAVTSEVTAPVVEDTTADVAEEAFTDEAAPEVATEETVAPATTAEVNTDGYTSDFKVTMDAAGWGTPVKVTGTLKDKNGSVVKTSALNVTGKEKITASYTWLADGRQAYDSSATGDIANNTEVKAGTNGSIPAYTPDQKDFNKELSLMVTVKRGNTVIYQETIVGGVVGAKDISDELDAALTGIDATYQYNGKEQKPVPENDYNAANGKIQKQHITWNYATDGNDFTNYTNKEITVTGTLEGTYDATSEAYGYKGHTASTTYKIAKRNISASDLVAAMKTTSVQFTGSEQKFGKADVTLGVKIDDDTTIDITDAIKSDATIEGTAGETAVTDNGYTLTIPVSVIKKDSNVVNNFNVNGLSDAATTTTTNKYKIVARNLSKCTGEVKTDIKFDTVKDKKDDELLTYINSLGSKIELKGDDGKTFTLADISDYVTVTVESALTNAIKNKTTGVVNNAIKIAYKSDEKSVTGSILLPVRLTTQSLSDAVISVKGITLATTAEGAKATDKDLSLTYDGKAKKLEDMTGFTLSGVSGIQSGEYEISYDDNISAGIVKVTLTGKKSYEGSVKNFYFKISPATIATSNIATTTNGVTINSANDTDAALYKDAVALKIEKALVSGDTTKTTLVEGKDYTVKYYYTSSTKDTVYTNAAEIDKSTAEAIKNSGSNVVGDYVTVVINIVKGNYSSNGNQYFAKSVPITEKSIEGVTITLEKTSYTFTGEKIVPEVVVKDGSSVLEKGVDYSLQVKDNRDVGTATVTVKALAGSDYKVNSTASTTFTITPAKAEDVKVTLSANPNGKAVASKDSQSTVIANTFNYNKGKQIQPLVPETESITLNGVDVTSEFDVKRLTYGDNNQAGKEMGTVTLSPKTGNKNFDGTKTQKFDIQGTTLDGELSVYGANKKALSVGANKIVSNYHFYYNGKDCTFADAALVPSIVAAKAGTDYEIKYVNNVDAGLGFVVAVAKGNYEGHAAATTEITWRDNNDNSYKLKDGKLTKNGVTLATNVIDAIAFEINSAVFTAKNITVTNGVYASGLPVQPQVTVSVAGKTLVEGTDYRLNIRPQDSDKGFTYPASVINATNGKVFYVDVIPMGGYEFDDVDGSNTFAWGIDKFDFAAADITSSGDTVTVKNGTMTVDPSDYTVTKDEAAGTVTVAAKEGSKNYTGSQTVKVNNVQVQAPVISTVKVVGNKATVILSGESDGASGYDYVISKANDYTTDRVDVTKNQLKTTGDFTYVQQGTYYAYCHAWTRGADGKKIFSGWSNIYPFAVSAITPSQPTITSVKTSGSTVTVTYTKSSNADGYDVVLGTATKKVSGETRPVEYGELVKKNIKGNTVTVTFKNVEKGTYYAGLHAFNRTAEDGKKVFSQWSNVKKVTVK